MLVNVEVLADSWIYNFVLYASAKGAGAFFSVCSRLEYAKITMSNYMGRNDTVIIVFNFGSALSHIML